MRQAYFALFLVAALLRLLLPIPAAASERCTLCHPQIAARYRSTPMARTSGPTRGLASAAHPEQFNRTGFSSPGGTAAYKVTPEYVLEFAAPGLQGRRSLDYFLGAGLTGRSYLTSIDGILFQAPAAWYSTALKWDLSPGYENTEAVNVAREVEPGCLRCHASGVGTRQPWAEDGVTCERCHGEGTGHGGRDGRIFNPARAPAGLAADTCAQCHLPGAVEIARPGRTFQVGSKLPDSVSIFVLEGLDRQATVNGHFEELSRSACARASGDALWCGSCHTIHSAPDYQAACAGCHADTPCKASRAVRSASKDDCIACHMPKTRALTVQHAAVTDHAISRMPRPSPVAVPSDAKLTLFGGGQAPNRDLGLAYATLGLRDNNRAWGLRGVELLEKSNPGQDAKVASALGQMYDRMGRQEQACARFAKAVELDGAAAAPLVNLGTCHAAKGEFERAITAWEKALRLSPGNESARLNLAVAKFRTGRKEEARAALTEALRFNPASLKAKELLAGMQ